MKKGTFKLVRCLVYFEMFTYRGTCCKNLLKCIELFRQGNFNKAHTHRQVSELLLYLRQNYVSQLGNSDYDHVLNIIKK